MPCIGEKCICKFCGKEFVAHAGYQKYCSIECQFKWHKKQRQTDIKPKACAVCGKIFQPKNNQQRFCSIECKKKEKRNNTVPSEEAPNRHISSLTAYLIQKWHKEGDSIEIIAKITKRSIENVEKALSMPLTLNEYKMMAKYFIPKKGTRK